MNASVHNAVINEAVSGEAGHSAAAKKFGILEVPELEYTWEVAEATASIYAKVSHIIPEIEWPIFAPMIAQVEAIRATGMVNLRLARLAFNNPGPAANAPERATNSPAPRTKSR